MTRPTIWARYDVDVRFRLHRFAAHVIEHTIQCEKALAALGWRANGGPAASSRQLAALDRRVEGLGASSQRRARSNTGSPSARRPQSPRDASAASSQFGSLYALGPHAGTTRYTLTQPILEERRCSLVLAYRHAAYGNAKSLATLANKGEELGFAILSVSDHIIIPKAIASTYPYNESGTIWGGSAGECMEQLSLLSFLAGITSSASLLTSVMVVPHRPPVLTANLATIDVLSNGRLLVGCGVAGCVRSLRPSGRRL